jgi:prepilin-type N-terminal cleavage/methylation domain-containing protein
MNNIMKNGNKGFSLVELIVVIAIMAVMTSVLAPALLGYVERSRAQKDDSAMSEVVNAVMLAMSDQDVYDEMLFYCAKGNVSSYIDSGVEAVGTYAEIYKEGTESGNVEGTVDGNDQYMYGADARLKDEEIYHAAGNMRGVTITFAPEKGSNGSSYDLFYGAVNSFIDDGTRAGAGSDTANGVDALRTVKETVAYFTITDPRADLAAKLGSDVGTVFGTYTYDATNQKMKWTAGTDSTGNDFILGGVRTSNSPNTYLYNRIRATVGDSIPLTSQTYRNSEYTIFIRMGSTGGNQASAQDAVLVYGQWNGTNLAAN